MAEVPNGYIVHLTPDRLRVRVPDRHRDQSFFDLAREQLSSWPMVERVDINPATASILIRAANTEAVLAMLEAGEPFAIVGSAPEPGGIGVMRVGEQLSKKLDEKLQNITRGRVTAARVSVLVGLGASVAFQLARGRRLSAAVTLLLFTGGALQKWWLSDGSADRDREFSLEQSKLAGPQLSGEISG